MTEGTRYLIVIRFADEGDLRARARESAPKVKAIIERLSEKECQLAFTSRDGSVFGYLLKVAVPLGQIRATLFGEMGGGTAALLRADHYFAVECGNGHDGLGFSRAWTWLQHH